MGNILTAKVRIKGTRPILWHWFGPDAIPLEQQEKTGVAGNDPQEWRKTVLFTKDGQLYVEPTYIFGCLCNGAKHTKKGRGSIQNLVRATLQVIDGRILINRFIPDVESGKLPKELTTDSDEEVYLDVRGVKNPATRGRNIRYRVAANHGWETEFTLQWDSTIVSRTQMEAVAIDGGSLYGIGDARNIGFGRFEVVDFDVIEE